MSALNGFSRSFWYRTPPTFAVGLILLQFPERPLIHVGGGVVLGLAVVEALVYACWHFRQRRA